MKEYRVQVVAKKTVVVSEIDWLDDGGIGEFDEIQAEKFAKGQLIDDLMNNPNRGSVKVTRIK
jgi:hypothetical protein